MNKKWDVMDPNRLVVGGLLSLGVMMAITGCARAVSTLEPSISTPDQSAMVSMDSLSKAEAPTLAAVKPPGNPKISDHFISDKKLQALPVRQQPPELAKALADLQTGSIDERKARIKAKVIADMVYVRGGSFMRGDFARLMGIEGVTRMTYNEDDKVLKEITLSDFWIGKYKVTYAEFDVFTDATGRPRSGMEFDGVRRHPVIPARAYWQTARDYCQWLGQLTGLVMDLPTEAQWEYAARSRGQFFAIPTDDGTIDYGRNVPYAAQADKLSPMGSLGGYPIGLFPANPLGLFDMSDNGEEWVHDWYAEDAYVHAESHDPQGPASGTQKVMRSWGGDSMKIGVAVWRRKEEPIPMWEPEGKLIPGPTSGSPSLRCAVNPAR